MLVGYLRVSTQRQGQSGLGIEAQTEAIQRHADNAGLPLIATFFEVESGAAKDRPELAAALALCRKRKAVLLIARLDRLSRSLSFIAKLLEAGVEVRCADMPEANRLTLQMLAVFAEHERRLIGERTRAALAAAKARGVRLGAHGAILAVQRKCAAREFAEGVRTHFEEAKRDGCTTQRAIAAWMNAHGHPSRDGGLWHASNVGRVLQRLATDCLA